MTDIELKLLALCVLHEDALDRAIISGVDPEWFTSTPYRNIWLWMTDRIKEAKVVDLVAISEFMKAKSYKFATELTHQLGDIVSPLSEIGTTIEAMRTRHQRRLLTSALSDAQRQVFVDDPGVLRDHLIDRLSAIKDGNGEKPTSVADEVRAMLSQVIEIRTGFPQLDWMTKGIRPEVWTIGAYTSNGKTMLANNLSLTVAKQGKPITYITAEMSRADLFKRWATMETGLNPEVRRLDVEEQNRFVATVHELEKLPITVIETNRFADVRMAIQKRRSALYVVDFLQLFYADSKDIENREYSNVSYCARETKNLSRDYGICIIQISRNKRTGDDGPTLSSYACSGEIEYSTDVGIQMVYPYAIATFEEREKLKAEGKDNIINIDIQKNRNHEALGYFKITFDRKTLRMAELTDREEEK